MKDYETITRCLFCDADTVLVLELPATPPANELLKEKSTQDTFPLNLMRCIKCNHFQLDTAVNLDRLFKHYLYKSNTSASNVKYFGQYAEDMIKRFDLTEKDLVVDIASNDGLFLSSFQKQNIKVLGIDPAENIAAAANAAGIQTLLEYFNTRTAKKIVKEHGQASLITCNNMFAHNKDLTQIINGVKKLLHPNGTFIFEVAYAIDMFKNNTFDLIYHEHIHHHTITPLVEFFHIHDMRLYNVEYIPTHGGSIRVYVCHRDGKYLGTSALTTAIWNETNGLNKLSDAFVKHTQQNIEDMRKVLQDIKQSGKTIGVLGWPAKATLMSYAYELEKYVSSVFDDNELKVGRYTPGKQMEVLPTKAIYEYSTIGTMPDYLLILAWNYAEPLMKTHTAKGFAGKFIIPFPHPTVVQPS